MQFTPAPIDPENPINVQAWHDETRTWRLEVNRVFFGYRVQLMHVYTHGSYPDVVLDYCAGADRTWVEALATVMSKALAPVPADVHHGQLHYWFPGYKRRPMHRDLTCWAGLCQLAGVDPARDLEDIAELEFDVHQAQLVQLYLVLRNAGAPEDQSRLILGTQSAQLSHA